MIEIGFGICEPCRNQGFGKEALLGMWTWVIDQPGVTTLRYTVSATNAPSMAIINSLGFRPVGQQIDETDGPEEIFEMSVTEFGSHLVNGFSSNNGS
jgi:RimJ/RimL family protein N-acetyltransferase